MRTISVPSRNADAALRRWASVRAGQSVPITRTGPALVATAASIRVLMSPCGCGLSVIFIRATIFRNVSCVASGSQHNVTGPMPAASAIATVRSVNLSCSTAAACAPIAGMSRALAKPGMGAFARIEIETGLVFSGGIALRDSPRISAEEIRQTERPHQEGWIYFASPDFTAEFPEPERSERADSCQSARSLATLRPGDEDQGLRPDP